MANAYLDFFSGLSRGRGENVGRFECIDPSFLWKEVPAGRRLGAQNGVKDDVRLSIF